MLSSISLGDILSFLNTIIGQLFTTDVLIGIVALVFAISIPLSILIVQEKPIGWDIKVIMDRVLRAKRLFLTFLIYIAVLTLWQIEVIRIFLFPFAIYSMYVFLSVIVDVYKWLTVIEPKGTKESTYRLRKRLEYLSTVGDEELSLILSMTWQGNDMVGTLDNREIIQIYSKKLKDILQDKEVEQYSYFIDALMNNIDEVNLEDKQIHDNILNVIVPHLFSIGSKEKSRHWKVNELYSSIINYDLQTRSGAYLFFRAISNFFYESNIDQVDLAQETTVVILDALNESNRDFAMKYFPDEWKITYDNLTKENNKITFAVLTQYINWIIRKVLLLESSEHVYDFVSDRATRALFPSVDLILWTDLLALFYASSGYEEGESSEYGMVKGFVLRNKTFGHIGHAHTVLEDDEDGTLQEEASIEEVIKILVKTKLFPRSTETGYINKLLDELENVIQKEKIQEGSIEYSRYKRLKYALNLILESINK